MRQVGLEVMPAGSVCSLLGGWSTVQAWTAHVFLTCDMDGGGPEPSDPVYTGPQTASVTGVQSPGRAWTKTNVLHRDDGARLTVADRRAPRPAPGV